MIWASGVVSLLAIAVGLPALALPLPVDRLDERPNQELQNAPTEAERELPTEGRVNAPDGELDTWAEEPLDIPEEVVRTEIILEARSPVDGAPLTAAEYVELMAELETRGYPPEVNSELQQLIFLLRARKLLRTFTPF
ncbi:MAG: hypothetical protein WBA10_14335 [Elainellaceae cyanobacterium]